MHAYAAKDFYLIQGAPGTGKTLLLAHLATQLARDGQRVLVTAFTHRAINNALVKIVTSTGFQDVVKIGQQQFADDLAYDTGAVRSFEMLASSPYHPDSEGIVIGATCFAVRTKRLQEMHFDTVIFDEAGQVTLPLAIAGMLAGDKAVFIGDHKQTAPVIVAEHPDPWVSKSIFETLFEHAPGTLLDVTYRMNAEINRYPSETFYGGRLKPHPGVAGKRLHLNRPPRKYAEILDPDEPDVFVEVNHLDRGMRSPEEADIAVGIVAEAIDCGIRPEDIAVVSPYRAQGRLIRAGLHKYMEGRGDRGAEIVVDTVERIQGQERELILISLTTSDPAHAAQRGEFYFQPNRLNVAITRPRVKRIILGNPLLFRAEPRDPRVREWVTLFSGLHQQCRKVVVEVEGTRKRRRLLGFLGKDDGDRHDSAEARR